MGDNDNGSSFNFENKVEGGTAQINQGQNVTASQTVQGGGPSWDDVVKMVGEDTEGHVEHMREAATAVALTEDKKTAFQKGLAWLDIDAPDTLPIVKELVAGSPELLELFPA